ncbi:hypothetical protein PA7_46620 [Pseudonocardia asaccharolytica DSM 44247 = NBRC 16224]|uniref:Uncharacterized protein n=1 Tax=Pseudonocardia asaccharolytica DSM 44247 = NBRC 16224 TaxID=1123024 RepID=A0A511D7N7_9PSEU|nr:hypothetical protein PA7_46620 [Pseudonocardia asaccharolytica DSM 44247 = NBRC 16224]
MADLRREEVGLTLRNHGFLHEALRYPVAPVGTGSGPVPGCAGRSKRYGMGNVK